MEYKLKLTLMDMDNKPLISSIFEEATMKELFKYPDINVMDELVKALKQELNIQQIDQAIKASKYIHENSTRGPVDKVFVSGRWLSVEDIMKAQDCSYEEAAKLLVDLIKK